MPDSVPADSILVTTKRALGLEPDYDAFDVDVIMHINSVFFKLQQLGIGPIGGYSIEDSSAAWSEYLNGSNDLHAVKTYMYLSVRLLFDPPATSFAITSMENQIKEFEWRLNARREEVTHPWVDPATMVPDLDL